METFLSLLLKSLDIFGVELSFKGEMLKKPEDETQTFVKAKNSIWETRLFILFAGPILWKTCCVLLVSRERTFKAELIAGSICRIFKK
jgi:hypothetical protein